jgi:hypothetical protein
LATVRRSASLSVCGERTPQAFQPDHAGSPAGSRHRADARNGIRHRDIRGHRRCRSQGWSAAVRSRYLVMWTRA